MALVLVILGGWEVLWRSRGFHPGFNDDKVLWSHSRRQVEPNDPGEVVLIGASRIKIGIDLEVFKEEFGRKPVQLGIDGCLCLPVLNHLANSEDFCGLVVADVWPTAFYKTDPAPGGASTPVEYYESSNFSQDFEELLQLQVQRALTFRLPDLSPKQLRTAYEDEKWPKPRHVRLFYDRSQKADYSLVDTYDLPMFIERDKPPPGDPASKSPEDWLAMVHEIQGMVEKIQSRGGQVVFAFIPSSDSTRQWEEDNWPRYKYWDVLAENTTALTIHPDDYRSLDGFHCPDGSHLDCRDAPRFTRVFTRVLKDVLAGKTPPDYCPPEARAADINLASKAAVLEAPEFAEGYPPEAILREVPEVLFSSAVTPNPSTMIFDLGQETQAALLQMVQYAYPGSTWSYEDYAWHVSPDRRTWIPVFDARAKAVTQSYSSHPTCTAFDLRDFEPFRYLRFVLRRATKDDRLLMRRVLLWSSYCAQDSLKPVEPLYAPSPLASEVSQDEPAVDLAAGATLASGPLFKQGHDFSVAVRGREDARYAETAEPGPFRLVVDLGWTVEATTLELLYASPFAAPRSYRWEASEDRETWTEVHDSDGKRATITNNALKRRYSLIGIGPIRFLRLTTRDKDLGSKLQLRRLSVFREAAPPPPQPAATTSPPTEAQIDIAKSARVLEAPECVLGYEFSVALRGCEDGKFVSASERCPSTIILDLEKTRPASLLKLHGHDALRTWEDYAILVSEDGQSWFEVFDARSETRRSLIPFSELVTGYDLRDASAFRYIRLDVRSAKQENRILLNRLSVWVEDDSATWPNAIEVERIAP